MQVIDEITRNKVGYGNCKRVIVGYAENGDIIYGYTRQWKEKCLRVRAEKPILQQSEWRMDV